MTTVWSPKAARVRLHGLAARCTFYGLTAAAKILAEEAVSVGTGELDIQEDGFTCTLYRALCATPHQRAAEVILVEDLAYQMTTVNMGNLDADARFSKMAFTDLARPRESQPSLYLHRGIYKVECPSFDPEDFAATGQFRCVTGFWTGGAYTSLGYANYERTGSTFQQEHKLIPAKEWLAIQKSMAAAFDAGVCTNCGTAGPHNHGGHSFNGKFVATCRICNVTIDNGPAEPRVYRVESVSGEATFYDSLASLFDWYNDLTETDVYRLKCLRIVWSKPVIIHSGSHCESYTVTRHTSMHNAESKVNE